MLLSPLWTVTGYPGTEICQAHVQPEKIEWNWDITMVTHSWEVSREKQVWLPNLNSIPPFFFYWIQRPKAAVAMTNGWRSCRKKVENCCCSAISGSDPAFPLWLAVPCGFTLCNLSGLYFWSRYFSKSYQSLIWRMKWTDASEKLLGLRHELESRWQKNMMTKKNQRTSDSWRSYRESSQEQAQHIQSTSLGDHP